MLSEFFQGCFMCNFSTDGRNKKKISEILDFFEEILCTYFGHGVIFDRKSSMANDMPRINRQLPNPFHNVVTP